MLEVLDYRVMVKFFDIKSLVSNTTSIQDLGTIDYQSPSKKTQIVFSADGMNHPDVRTRQ